MPKILLIGGNHHSNYHCINQTLLYEGARFQVADLPEELVLCRHGSTIPDPMPTYSLTTYEVDVVMKSPWQDYEQVVDYYAKECSMSAEESFELYKEITKEK